VETKDILSYLLPLGPFHPAIRTPQRIVLRAEGEIIHDIEHRGGYQGRDIAERVRRSDLARSYPLINRICGVHAHHHALAWTMALEELAGIDVPQRAHALRTIAAELERAASHLQQTTIVFQLLGLTEVEQQLSTLRDHVLRVMQQLTGHRLIVDFARPGGVTIDLSAQDQAQVYDLVMQLAETLYGLAGRIIRRRGFTRRVAGIGTLQRSAAETLGVAGPVARAAGLQRDARVDAPYAAYGDARPAQLAQTSGDTYARLMLLLLEAYDSLQIILRVLDTLPDGPWQGEILESLPVGTSTVLVEAPAGPLHYTIVSDGTRLTTFKVEAGCAPHRLVWRALLARQRVEDAAIIVASVGACTACAED